MVIFDFIGFLPGHIPSNRLPFGQVLSGTLPCDAVQQRFSSPLLAFQSLHRSGPADQVAKEEDLFVALLGTCYARVGEEALMGGVQLGAAQLAAQYRAQELGILSRIKGNFILLISDENKQKTYFAAAPLCMQSLYYRQTVRGMVFSTSLAAMAGLLERSGEPLDVDDTSLLEYYLFDFTLGAHTALAGVNELQAGELLTVDRGKGRISTFADPESLFPMHSRPRGSQASVEKLVATLEANVHRCSDGPEQTAVALTGGYDSRSVAALIGSDWQQYAYYSYGDPQSWDVKIPRELARKNRLDYQCIDLSSTFRDQFHIYARQAIETGDGIGEASRANYPYVYGNFLSDKKSILTGLLGSELIKTPSSRGLFIDEPMLELLRAKDPELVLRRLYDKVIASGLFDVSMLETQRNELFGRVLGNPLLHLQRPLSEKLFYFILWIGCRKYFAKEIKLQRYYVVNKTPFYDIDFIRTLLQTPFPWVYHGSTQKSLYRNMNIHQVYTHFIRRRPGYLGTLTTHGFKPGHLLSPLRYPLLVANFLATKRKIARESRVSFDADIVRFFEAHSESASSIPAVYPKRLDALRTADFKNYVKLKSLDLWRRSAIGKHSHTGSPWERV